MGRSEDGGVNRQAASPGRRRALLQAAVVGAAAAGGAGLLGREGRSLAHDPDDVQKGVSNAVTTTTTLSGPIGSGAVLAALNNTGGLTGSGVYGFAGPSLPATLVHSGVIGANSDSTGAGVIAYHGSGLPSYGVSNAIALASVAKLDLGNQSSFYAFLQEAAGSGPPNIPGPRGAIVAWNATTNQPDLQSGIIAAAGSGPGTPFAQQPSGVAALNRVAGATKPRLGVVGVVTNTGNFRALAQETGVAGVSEAGGATDVGVLGVALLQADALPAAPAQPVGAWGVANRAGAVGVLAQSTSGTALRADGTSTFTGNATFNGQVITSGPGSKFVGNGLGLSALNASFLTVGTVPVDRIPGLDASKITSGRLAVRRLPRNVALRTSRVTPFAGKVSAAQFSGSRGKPAIFSSAGSVSIPAGKRTARVKSGAVGPKTHVLVTLQSDAGPGVGVLRIDKLAGGFRAVLTEPATKAATLAYFVLGQP